MQRALTGDGGGCVAAHATFGNKLFLVYLVVTITGCLTTYKSRRKYVSFTAGAAKDGALASEFAAALGVGQPGSRVPERGVNQRAVPSVTGTSIKLFSSSV